MHQGLALFLFFFAGESSDYDSASSAVSEFCPHEDETTDESAEFSTEESVIGCQDNPEQNIVLHNNISVRQWYLLCRATASLALFLCLANVPQRVWELLALHRRNVKYL